MAPDRALYRDRELFTDIAVEQRRRGSPCLVQSGVYNDGVGSTSVRDLATWVFAEEMGCDWIEGGVQAWEEKAALPNSSGATLYCHSIKGTGRSTNLVRGELPKDSSATRCSMYNWFGFFTFDAHASKLKSKLKPGGRIENVKASDWHYLGEDLRGSVDRFFSSGGFEKPPWEHWLLTMGPMSAPNYFVNAQSWDRVKREATRKVLASFRESFHKFPRPWYDHRPECMYYPSQTHIAMHVRLGDRTAMHAGMENYFMLLERLMDLVASAFSDQGHDPPTFHLFSETASECPSVEDGFFEEFPQWPVEEDEITRCLEAEVPESCLEMDAGALACNPSRSGIFTVRHKPLILHVGHDVQNDLACMIEADAIVMGCSTFGHIAGVLNPGIKLFSISCGGAITTFNYQMMPPMAIVDQGSMWVPVSGSWRNPGLYSRRILDETIRQLFRLKRTRQR
eukprot:g7955.t1